MRLAILDDYENLAMASADWGSLGADVAIDVYHDPVRDENLLAGRLRPYEVLVIMRERTAFPGRLIERLPRLKLIVTTGSRNLAIDMAACKARGITVCGTASSRTAAAEHAWGLILATVRNIPRHDRAVRAGGWTEAVGSGLAGQVLGVLGLGKLGAQVARVGRAFGMEVIAWSQNLTAERAAEAGALRVDKNDLFARADILTIHLVLSERTRGLVGAPEVGRMKPGAYLINTSRGPIVEEEALIAALREKRIAGAGLDVFATEPLPPGHPFTLLSNTVLTPHVGYVTRENFKTYYAEACEDVAAWRAGGPMRVLSDPLHGSRA